MKYNSRAHAGLALITGSIEVMLCTVGVAGLQASYVNCSVNDYSIYAYVPRSSDQLANLEQASEVILTTPSWQLRGVGAAVADDTLQMLPVPPALASDIDRLGLAIVLIIPHRMHIDRVETMHRPETIDFATGESHVGVSEEVNV